MIYENEFDWLNLKKFKADLQANYNANIIKTKSALSHAFFITFRQEYLPYIQVKLLFHTEPNSFDAYFIRKLVLLNHNSYVLLIISALNFFIISMPI